MPGSAGVELPKYVAMIGDIVGSRRRGPGERYRLQQRFHTVLGGINQRFADAIAAAFLVTVGDEFQGLLSSAEPVSRILWDLEMEMEGIEFRVGIGCGPLDTAVKPEAIGMDGPAFHRARNAVEAARSEKRTGGVFLGFGERWDAILNGYGRLLHHQRSGWSAKQRQAVAMLCDGASQADVAAALVITPQAVSERARRAGWEAYREAEHGWRAALALATQHPHEPRR